MVTGQELSTIGFRYIGVSYSVMDCQAFVEKCLSDCGIKKDLAGSNAWYRFIMRNGWVGSPEECKRKFGSIPVGAFLFILKQDGREPPKYHGDGIGNANHIGIYTAKGQGAINSSASRGCVCESKFSGKSINGGWNRVGLWKGIFYSDSVNRILNGEEVKPVEVSYQAKVVGGGLNMRRSPENGAERLLQIPDGTILTITEESGEWAKTGYSGKTGWVMKKYLEEIGPDKESIVVSRKELETLYDTIGDWLGLRG